MYHVYKNPKTKKIYLLGLKPKRKRFPAEIGIAVVNKYGDGHMRNKEKIEPQNNKEREAIYKSWQERLDDMADSKGYIWMAKQRLPVKSISERLSNDVFFVHEKDYENLEAVFQEEN